MKYLNKSLLFKEWKVAKWFLIINTWCIFLFKTCIFINDMLDKLKNPNRYFYLEDSLGPSEIDFGIIILIAIMVIVLFDKRNFKGNFLYSMPFTRKEIIVSKLFTGIFVIVISMLINYIIIMLIYFFNCPKISDYFDYKDIWGQIGFTIVIYIGAFIYLMFIQCFTNNKIWGIVFAVFVPLFFIMPFLPTTSGQHANISIFGGLLLLGIDLIDSYSFLIDLLIGINDKLSLDVVTLMNAKYLIFMSLILFCLTVILFSKSKFEKSARLIVYKPVEKISKVLLAISAGCMGDIVASAVFKFDNSIVYALILISIFLFTYFIENKKFRVMRRKKQNGVTSTPHL